jgi:hypothetical protein
VHAALPLREIEQREQVTIDRVNAAVANEAHEVQRPACLSDVRGSLRERRNPEERPVADCEVDANDVLHHDPAGAKVEVPDFAVSHLPLGQSNG